jgi:hypothetical protein
MMCRSDRRSSVLAIALFAAFAAPATAPAKIVDIYDFEDTLGQNQRRFYKACRAADGSVAGDGDYWVCKLGDDSHAITCSRQGVWCQIWQLLLRDGEVAADIYADLLEGFGESTSTARQGGCAVEFWHEPDYVYGFAVCETGLFSLQVIRKKE